MHEAFFIPKCPAKTLVQPKWFWSYYFRPTSWNPSIYAGFRHFSYIEKREGRRRKELPAPDERPSLQQWKGEREKGRKTAAMRSWSRMSRRSTRVSFLEEKTLNGSVRGQLVLLQPLWTWKWHSHWSSNPVKKREEKLNIVRRSLVHWITSAWGFFYT